MLIEKNAVLLFCKPPVPGLVKTRLTRERGGNLTPEDAAEFFRCSLLDVCDLVILALEEMERLNTVEREQNGSIPKRTYDLFVSTTSANSVDAFKKLFADDGPWTRSINYLIDHGASFDEHFDDAFGQLFAAGYRNVVAVGGDMPTLPLNHVVEAFRWLDYLANEGGDGSAVVLAPCQQSGVSLVGLTATTPIDSRGVYYNLSGLPALDAYTQKARETDIPLVYLHPVSDVDGDADLAHAISCLNAMAEAVRFQPEIVLARRVLEWIDKCGLRASAPPNDDHDPRHYLDTEVESLAV
jgi:glycosyltransferase A (GT-A) superfamily protein (DUF2064 family)